MASCSATTPQWKYDVFLSFRGKDTRYNFTSHLYDALCRKNIMTFIDNGLERGEEITPALFRIIEESRISVVIFSRNYASSPWCVDELVKILECRNKFGQIVLPVFYHVDPSDVEDQKGNIAIALAELESNFNWKMNKVPGWRDELTKLASISGWVSLDTRLESKLVNEIVECVVKRLNCASSANLKGLVGVLPHISEIKRLLSIDFPDVRFLGLWGMGGMGKTTIAGAVFNYICSEYEGCCFLANVWEASKEYRGLVCLREELLSTLLEEQNLHSLAPNIVLTAMMGRLQRKKVLIVLDDVNDVAQVEFLIEGRNLFGPGSRIIITSRDKQVLKNTVDEIYQIEELSYSEALQLFSLHAFKQNYPTRDLVELSKRVINYAQGNPLALKVLGAFLFERRKQDWEGALHKLKNNPNKKVQNVLRTSFEALDDEEKNIFLDIACFFKGQQVDFVERILDGCGFSTKIGLSVLTDKCLITTSENKLGIHALLQEMAYEIVRQESLRELGKRSRLWNPKDVHEVLRKNLGTENVEGIFLDTSKIKETELSSRAFARMHNLRLLKIYNSELRHNCKLRLPDGLETLSDELRYLHWDGYPLGSLPSSFHPENLVDLNLSFSNVKQLWKGVQNLANLKEVNLSNCDKLISLPDLSQAKSLERLNLEGCASLTEVPASIRFLDRLVDFDMRHCTKLQGLPCGINLKCLETIKLSGCSKLKQCPEISRSITYLNLNETAIEVLPPSIGHLCRLTALNLKDCKWLADLPDSISVLKSLVLLDLSGCSNISKFPNVPESTRYLYLRETAVREIPSSLCFPFSITILDLSNCSNLNTQPGTFSKFVSLEKLVLSGCSSITSFPEVSRKLKELYLDQTAIAEIPSLIECASGLVELHLSDCKNFVILPSSICKLKSLQKLNLSGCSEFESFPEIMEPMKSLRYLYLDGTAIRELPSPMENVSCLSCLELRNCMNLVNLPGMISPAAYSVNLPMRDVGPIYLRKLDLNCCSIQIVPFSIGCLSSLEALDLSGNNFMSLPVSISRLSELQYLGLKNCSKLKSLPELPPQLTKLDADNCGSLSAVSSSSSLTEGNIFDFFFRNCFNLDEIAQSNIMVIAFIKIQLYAKRLFVKVPSVPTGVSSFCFPGIKIPQWFDYQSWGNAISMPMPSHSFSGKFLGFAVCCAIASYASCFGFQIKCSYLFKNAYGDCQDLHCYFGGWYGNGTWQTSSSSHLFLGYDPCLDALEGDCFGKYSEVLVQFYPEDMNGNPRGVVILSGVHPLYAPDEKGCEFVVPRPYSHNWSLLVQEIDVKDTNSMMANAELKLDPRLAAMVAHKLARPKGSKNEMIDPRGFKEFFLNLDPALFNLVLEPSVIGAFAEELMQICKTKADWKFYNEAKTGGRGFHRNMEIDTSEETELMNEEGCSRNGVDAGLLRLQDLIEEQIHESTCVHWDLSYWLRGFIDLLSAARKKIELSLQSVLAEGELFQDLRKSFMEMYRTCECGKCRGGDRDERIKEAQQMVLQFLLVKVAQGFGPRFGSFRRLLKLFRETETGLFDDQEMEAGAGELV